VALIHANERGKVIHVPEPIRREGASSCAVLSCYWKVLMYTGIVHIDYNYTLHLL
jgi:hypothetical protein